MDSVTKSINWDAFKERMKKLKEKQEEEAFQEVLKKLDRDVKHNFWCATAFGGQCNCEVVNQVESLSEMHDLIRRGSVDWCRNRAQRRKKLGGK